MPAPIVTTDSAPRADTRSSRPSEVLLIDGMFCAACAASVESAIRRHPTVREVTVNFAAQAAVIARTPDATASDLETLLARVRKLGYRARAADKQEADRSSARDSVARDLSLRLILAVFFAMWVMLPSIGLYLNAGAGEPEVQLRLALAAGLFSLPVVLWSGVPFYRMAWATLRAGAPGVDTLVTIGVAGALALSALALVRGSTEVYFEVAVALITLQLLARLIDLRVRLRAREAIGALLALSPTRLRQVTQTGDRELTLKEVKTGDRLRVLAGERLAVDGVVCDGYASVDGSLLSGESTARAIEAGSPASAGERLIDGTIVLEVTAGAGGRRLDALAKQVRQLLASKPPWQRLVDRLARHFLWLSLALALAAAAVVVASGASAEAGALRALAVFVIACPCALSLAAPLAGLCASQAASKRGVVLRDLNAITSAALPTHLFLDKTGTLTTGEPCVDKLHTNRDASERELLCCAASAESLAVHPLARGILAAARERGCQPPQPMEGARIAVTPGRGVHYTAPKGSDIHVGAGPWFESLGLGTAGIAPTPAAAATRVWVARGGTVLGAIDLIDVPRPGAREAVEHLRAKGLEITILSGDAPAPVEHLAHLLGVAWAARLSPEEKVTRINGARQAPHAVVAFVGDGLNDGPALAAADLGIAVGGATDAARAAAAVTLVSDGVEALPAVLLLIRRLRTVVRRNLAWAIAYNALALPAAAAGWVHPAVAASAMALSSISIILSAASAGR